jgi:hypothetical protein
MNKMKMPAKGKYYSCSEANINLYPEQTLDENRLPLCRAHASLRHHGAAQANQSGLPQNPSQPPVPLFPIVQPTEELHLACALRMHRT